MDIIQERILLVRIKNKNREAALSLIDEHYKLVYHFLFKLCKEKVIAQDLTQETFIKAWDKIENFNGQSRFSTWLYRISYNVFIDYKRMNTLNTIALDVSEVNTVLECTAKIDEDVSLKLQYEAIMKFVNNLSEKYKEVILLHYVDDLSIKEIGVILNIPKGTVKLRINGALVELRNKLK